MTFKPIADIGLEALVPYGAPRLHSPYGSRLWPPLEKQVRERKPTVAQRLGDRLTTTHRTTWDGHLNFLAVQAGNDGMRFKRVSPIKLDDRTEPAIIVDGVHLSYRSALLLFYSDVQGLMWEYSRHDRPPFSHLAK